jgi:hypothetical protein
MFKVSINPNTRATLPGKAVKMAGKFTYVGVYCTLLEDLQAQLNNGNPNAPNCCRINKDLNKLTCP